MSRRSSTGDRGRAGCRRRIEPRLWLASWLLVAVPLAAPLAAQVKIVQSTDGRTLLSNDPPPRAASAPRLSEPSLDLLEIIDRHATDRRLDPLLVRAIIQIESDYDPMAVSHKGAMGLMQLMPRTAAQLEIADPLDPEANIRGGTEYLRLMLDVFEQDLTLALAGYNAGPEAVRRYGGVPPYAETRAYLRRVLSVYEGSEFVDIPETTLERGRKTFLVRRGGRLVMTTTPPSRR